MCLRIQELFCNAPVNHNIAHLKLFLVISAGSINPCRKYFLLDRRNISFKMLSCHATNVDDVTSQNLLTSFENIKRV